jgi:hypothetical protein
MDFITNLNTNLNAEHIRNILSHLGERKLPTRKAEMAQRLNRVWLEEPSRLLDALSEPERLLLAECAHTGDPEPDVAGLNAKHGFSYNIPHHGSWRDHHFVLCFLARDDRWSYELVDGVIVTFRDEETATLVFHDTAAAKTIFCREGSSVVICARKSKAFQSALCKLGILLP